jgi:hypothetical protein
MTEEDTKHSRVGRMIMTIKFSDDGTDDTFVVVVGEEKEGYFMRQYAYSVIACEVVRASDTGDELFELDQIGKLGNRWIES